MEKAALSKKKTFHQWSVLKFQEETGEVLHLKRSIVWCQNLNTFESRSQIPGKFWNVVLEKDGEFQLDRL